MKENLSLCKVISRLQAGKTVYVRVADYSPDAPPMVAYEHYYAALNPPGGYMIEIHRFADNSQCRWRMYDGAKAGKWYPCTILYYMVSGAVSVNDGILCGGEIHSPERMRMSL